MAERQFTFKEKRKIFTLSHLAYSYIGMMDKTLRWKTVNNSSNTNPALYAIWHGYQYSLLGISNRSKLHILISKSNDGEIISRICNWLGFSLIRGSKGRDGTEALRSYNKSFKTGRQYCLYC